VLYQLSYTPSALKVLAFIRVQNGTNPDSRTVLLPLRYQTSSARLLIAARSAPSTADAASPCMFGLRWL
jgi:hypothetical protein